MQTRPSPRWVVRPGVPDEVYTDRQEFLEYFYQAALNAAQRRTKSTVLLGQRRMGKTEIFLRVVNRLFWEQDHQDPQAVVPIYFSFPDEIVSRQDFAMKYAENFLRWYAAFKLRDPDVLKWPDHWKPLCEYVREHLPISRGFEYAFDRLQSFNMGGSSLPSQSALHLPRDVSDRDDSTIVMFLDEFQNTHLPEYQFRVVGFMQHAVESPTCPHFVTGSAMSILSREIIGRGALFGRFRGKDISAFSAYWGAQLALNAARYYQVDLPELMAPVLAERCGNNPFYITAVIQQAAESQTALNDEHTLNTILAVDISSGFIWGELHDQVTRWIKRITPPFNPPSRGESGGCLTKWVLYLSAIGDEDKVSVEQIQRELKAREGKDVPLDTIREILVKLSRGDLVDYLELGGWFRKVNDPILLEFLKVWGKIEVEGHPAKTVQDDFREQYETLQRRYHEYKGYLGEVFMSQILLGSSRKTFPGHVFHVDEDVTMPWQFSYVHHRVRLGSGAGKEIDLFGAAGSEVWIGQSKWWTTKKVGMKELRDFLAQGEQVQAERTPRTLRLWLFAYNGLTPKARAFARNHNILWSSKTELNELLRLLGLRELPDLPAEEQEE